MLLKLFTVYDSKVEAYLTPFFMQSKGEALRAWATTVNDPKTTFCSHPADFTLFEIGEFDSVKGAIKPYSAPISLGTALEHKREPSSPAPLLDAIKGARS